MLVKEIVVTVPAAMAVPVVISNNLELLTSLEQLVVTPPTIQLTAVE